MKLALRAERQHRRLSGLIMAGLALAMHVGVWQALGVGGVHGGDSAGSAKPASPLTVELRAAGSDPAAARQDAQATGLDRRIAADSQGGVAPAGGTPVAGSPAVGSPAASVAQPGKPEPLLAVTATAHYHPLGELSEHPAIVHDVAPDISFMNLPFGAVQTARLRLLINESGDIDRVEVSRSQLSADVVKAVIAAYSQLKFRPGKIGEVAVKTELRIEVRLENALTPVSDARARWRRAAHRHSVA